MQCELKFSQATISNSSFCNEIYEGQNFDFPMTKCNINFTPINVNIGTVMFLVEKNDKMTHNPVSKRVENCKQK